MGDGWQVAWEGGAILGEGVLWDARDGCVWWVDIKAPAIHWLPLDGSPRGSWVPPCKVGSILPRLGGGFVGGTDRGLALIDPKAGKLEIIATPEADRPQNRFNDGALDAKGRFWAGSMDESEKGSTGALYRLDPDHSWVRLDDGYNVANGPAFSPDGRTLYHNDSGRRRTYAFDLAADGSLANRRVLIEHEDGYPDGMVCDSEGTLWIAIWKGWELRRFDPQGRRIEARRLPVAQPTRPVFAGASLDRLFVTSASVGVDMAGQPFAGALFEIESPGARGMPLTPFAG